MDPPLYRRILLPTDGGDASQRAILAGVAFARVLGAELVGVLLGSQTRKALVHSTIPVLVHR